jgi:hypothetical protein
MFFLVDLRDGDELNFTISGISVSAKEDFPHAADVSLSLDAPELASSICGRIVSSCPVVWECGDFLVPVTFTFSGPPLACIVALAAEIGAIVRCNDAGELVVRKKRPVRPVVMDGASAAVDYTSYDLISLSAREDPESGYTGVEVIGRPTDIWMPLLQLEESSPVKGDRVFMDVFWQGRLPSVSETYVSAGEMRICGNGVFYTMESVEVVDFKDGVGSVSLPVDEIVSVEWIGDHGSDVIAPVNGQELMIEDNSFRVARVKYRSTYQRYILDSHFVERLIAVLFLQSVAGVWVRVLTDGPDGLGPAISAPMLDSEAAAVERATAWIDENKYRKSVLSVSAPYQDAAVDGTLAYINDDYIGAPGNYHIKTSRIQIAGGGVKNILELEKCLISFNS